MDLNELRETKTKLEHVANYCLPETASDREWAAAEKRAVTAGNKLAQLETTFALLAAVDALTERVTALEKTTMCICLDCERGDEGWCPNSPERSNHDR